MAPPSRVGFDFGAELPPIDSDSSDPDSGNEDDDNDVPVRSLATQRAKRSKAGNNMRAVIANEVPDGDPEDDLTLLFAEEEGYDDSSFSEADEYGDDADMVVSDDGDTDDDAGDDDSEGEREFMREERAQRRSSRKRKALDPFRFRKKARLDTSATATTTASPSAAGSPSVSVTPTPGMPRLPRPKRRSERSSWLPDPADAPTRASQRTTTRDSKRMLEITLLEREARRSAAMAQQQVQEAGATRRNKLPMTQAEHLAEAALVERRNAKSLNRWEEAERVREEERRAKLAALAERKLQGPVISFWSGMRIGHPAQTIVVVEDKPKRTRPERPDKPPGRGKGWRKGLGKKNYKAEGEDGDSAGTIGPAALGVDPVEPGGATARHPAGPGPDSMPHPATSSAPAAASGGASGSPVALVTRTDMASSGQLAQLPSSPRKAAPLVSQRPQDALVAVGLPGGQGMAAPPLVPPFRPVPSSGPPPPAAGGSDPPPGFKLMAPPPSSHTQTGLAKSPISRAAGDGVLAPPPSMPLNAPEPSPVRSDGRISANSLPQAPPPPAALSAATPPTSVLPEGSASGATKNALQAPHAKLKSLSIPLPARSEPGAADPPRAFAEKPSSPSSTPRQTYYASLPRPKEQAGARRQDEDSEDGIVSHPTKGVPVIESLPIDSPMPDTPLEEQDKEEGGSPTEQTPTIGNAILLQNFDETLIRDKAIQAQILFGHRISRPAKASPHPLCVITNHPARYRDPHTSLPFYNATAYRELKNLREGKYRWSGLLGAWIGGNDSAKGAPAWFTDPNAPDSEPETRQEEPKRQSSTIPIARQIPAATPAPATIAGTIASTAPANPSVPVFVPTPTSVPASVPTPTVAPAAPVVTPGNI